MDIENTCQSVGRAGREELTSQVPSKHQIQDEETIFVILESITHVDHKGVIDLQSGNTY